MIGGDIDGEGAGDYSGYSVSLSADGTIVAIGAMYNDGNGADSGHVRVYKYEGSSWEMIGGDIDGEGAGDYSGYSVSLSADGTIVAIGATGNDGNGANSGHVRIFTTSTQVSKAPTTQVLVGWNIENNGEVTGTINSDGRPQIFIPINASNRESGVNVFTEDCLTSFYDTNYFEVDTTNSTSSMANGYIQFDTSLTVNVSALNKTEYWKPFTDGTRGGSVEVCLETFLKYKKTITDHYLGNDDDDEQRVNFINNILNISVSFTSSFTIDSIKVKREDEKREDIVTDYSDSVTGYLCQESNLYTAAAAKTYKQGEEIIICVTTKDFVQVQEFYNLKVSQEGKSDYHFIKGTLFNPAIVNVACKDGTDGHHRVCYAKILVLARFFDKKDPSDLFISGQVFFIRNGRRVRRNLRMALPGPDKNDDEGALKPSGSLARANDEDKSEDFEVIVALGSSKDSSASVLTAGLFLMAVGAAGAALMV